MFKTYQTQKLIRLVEGNVLHITPITFFSCIPPPQEYDELLEEVSMKKFEVTREIINVIEAETYEEAIQKTEGIGGIEHITNIRRLY